MLTRLVALTAFVLWYASLLPSSSRGLCGFNNQIAQPLSSTGNDEPQPERTEVCFLTYEFGVPGKRVEQLANLTQLGISLKSNKKTTYRYLAFTNDAKADLGHWEKIVVDVTHNYTKPKTASTYYKFLAWQHKSTQRCRTIFVMDGILFPIPKKKLWQDMEARIHASPGGLLVQHKTDNMTVGSMMNKLVKLKKDTSLNVQATRQWLESRPDYRKDCPCLFTNFFGYNPANPLYQEVSSKFWHYYSTEMLTPRDQPLFSYFVNRARDRMKPALIRHFGFKRKRDEGWELRPYDYLCDAALRIRRQQQGEKLKGDRMTGAYETHFDPDLVLDVCTKTKRHDFIGLQTFHQEPKTSIKNKRKSKTRKIKTNKKHDYHM